MKHLLILSLLTGLFSCSGYYHIKQAKKHARKAEIKGITPERDTTYFTKSDTITKIDTLDNFIRVTKTIRDTVYMEGETVYVAKSRTQVRQEERTNRVEARQEGRTERKEIKAKNKSKRFPWFIMFVVCGYVIGVYIYKKFVIKKK